MVPAEKNIATAYKDFFVIEIAEKCLKLAFVKISKEKQEIVGVFASEISSDADEKIPEKIKEFAAKHHIKKCETVNVIPSHFAITKNIEIPSIDKKEIKEIIDLQAGRHTPYSRDEIVMDYMNIGVFHERYTKILLVLVKRDVVSGRYETIKKAGFKANTAFLTSEPISQLCCSIQPKELRDKTLGLIHVDKYNIDFIISNKGVVVYTRSIPIGAAEITADLQTNKQKILDEIKKSVESYQSENMDSLPAHFFVVGATDCVSSFTEEVKGVAGTGVDVIPYSKIFATNKDISEALSGNKDSSFLDIIAASFAFQQSKLNLIPEDVKINQALKAKAKEVTIMGMSAMAVLVILCALLLTGMIFKKIYLKNLLSRYSEKNEEVQDLKEIRKRTGTIKRFLDKKGVSLYVLTELYSAIPDEVYLSSIGLREDGSVMLAGTADSMSMVFSLVTDLENNKSFKNVKVDFTKSRMLQGKELADFGLSLLIEQRS